MRSPMRAASTRARAVMPLAMRNRVSNRSERVAWIVAVETVVMRGEHRRAVGAEHRLGGHEEVADGAGHGAGAVHGGDRPGRPSRAPAPTAPSLVMTPERDTIARPRSSPLPRGPARAAR